MIDQAKILLGIHDDLQDNLLNALEKGAEQMVLSWIKSRGGSLEEVPSELGWVMTELVVARFRRLGSEGMTKKSIQGLDMTFAGDDLVPYESYLEPYTDIGKKPAKEGQVWWW